MQELVTTMRTNKPEEERLAATEAASATQSAESVVAAVAALADGDEADSGKETARAVLATALSTLATGVFAKTVLSTDAMALETSCRLLVP